VAAQNLYRLVERGYEHTHADLVAREGLAALPYYALAAGFLTGKYRPGVQTTSVRANGPRPGGARSYLDERGIRLLGVLDQIAAEYATTVAAISLAWLRSRPTVVAPIASARTVEQLRAILPSATLTLCPHALEQLTEASAEHPVTDRPPA
jgi:aryl-alcohol dehydrogenase (NADP+)